MKLLKKFLDVYGMKRLKIFSNILMISFLFFSFTKNNYAQLEKTSTIIEWYVSIIGDDQTGNGSFFKPFRTIQKAMNNAKYNDVVFVSAGTFNETVTIPSGVTLKRFGGGGSTVIKDVFMNDYSIIDGVAKNFIIEDGIYGPKYGTLVSNVTIINNFVKGNPYILAGIGDNSYIRNNILIGDGWGGCIELDGDNIQLKNNTLCLTSGFLSDIVIRSNHQVKMKNCILVYPTSIFLNDNASAIVTYSNVSGGWAGEGNINVDPLFVDPANNDFHLQSQSPCIDAGNPNDDYSKEPQPNGGRINMGAYGNTSEATLTVTVVGNLVVTVKNINGTSTPYPGNNGVVTVYLDNNNKGSGTTVNGVATVSNLTNGSGYSYTVYHNGGTIFGSEYWGQETNVTISGSTSKTFNRGEPYGKGVHIYNVSTGAEVTNGSVVAGTTLRVELEVANPNGTGSGNRNIQGKVLIDKDKQVEYDFNLLSSVGVNVSAGQYGECGCRDIYSRYRSLQCSFWNDCHGECNRWDSVDG